MIQRIPTKPRTNVPAVIFAIIVAAGLMGYAAHVWSVK
jgi:hypothetical protein